MVHQRPAEHVAVELAAVDLGHAVATGEGIGELGRPRRAPGPAVELGEGTVAQPDRLGRELGGAGASAAARPGGPPPRAHDHRRRRRCAAATTSVADSAPLTGDTIPRGGSRRSGRSGPRPTGSIVAREPRFRPARHARGRAESAPWSSTTPPRSPTSSSAPMPSSRAGDPSTRSASCPRPNRAAPSPALEARLVDVRHHAFATVRREVPARRPARGHRPAGAAGPLRAVRADGPDLGPRPRRDGRARLRRTSGAGGSRSASPTLRDGIDRALAGFDATDGAGRDHGPVVRAVPPAAGVPGRRQAQLGAGERRGVDRRLTADALRAHRAGRADRARAT